MLHGYDYDFTGVASALYTFERASFSRCLWTPNSSECLFLWGKAMFRKRRCSLWIFLWLNKLSLFIFHAFSGLHGECGAFSLARHVQSWTPSMSDC